MKITPDIFERDSLPYAPYNFDGPYGFIANSSISDSNGNLLLYSFGVEAINKYGNIIQGGCCLCQDSLDSVACQDGTPHAQGALFLPRPSSKTQYYLFIKDESVFAPAEQPARITVTLIDNRANNDSGVVIQSAIPILIDTLSDSRMTASLHANGRDWWLINHKYNSGIIYTHLITPDSIYGPFEQEIGLPGLEPDLYGWSIFSHDGSIFATTTEGMGAITLLDFDRCSGTFSNFRSIPTNVDTGYYFNLAFSPNSRFLYAANARLLEQYDLQATDIEASRVQLVHDTAGWPLLGQMVLMPDGKIYQVGETVIDSMLSVIDSPDVKGLACGFHLRSLLVPNSLEITMVPNFPTYNLGPLVGSGCDTLNTAVAGILATKYQIQLFPNPANDIINITTTLNPTDYGVIDVYTVEGLKVNEIKVTGGTTTNTMQTDNLSNGVYLYYLYTNQQYNARGKLVIAK